jgi:hypothetical protein
MSKWYSEKLRDPRWHHKRDLILKRDDYKCRDCGSEDDLHVHHCYYHGDPWSVPNQFLITLCDPCHLQRQEFEDSLRLEIGRLSSYLKPADIDRFRARFRRVVFEFEGEIEKFSQLVNEIEQGNNVG